MRLLFDIPNILSALNPEFIDGKYGALCSGIASAIGIY